MAASFCSYIPYVYNGLFLFWNSKGNAYQKYAKPTMDKTGSYISLVWLTCLVSITFGLDVKTEVGRVEYGESVTLKCVLLPPNTAAQVIWTKVVDSKETTIATYTSDLRAEISRGYENRLRISITRLNETAITVYKTGLQDEGCYNCIFNSFSKAPQKGEMCLTIPGNVLTEKYHRVQLHQPVTLKCITRENSNQSKVLQVTWKKDEKNIVTYENGAYISPEYEGLIDVTADGPNVSFLSLFRARGSDEGRYKCVFSIFPGGSVSGETYLEVYEPLNVTMSKNEENGCFKITCVARSRPPSMIYWLDVDEGSLNSTTYDGSLTVTSWILINNPDSQKKKMPKCKVLYLGEPSYFSLSTGTRWRLHPAILGLLVSIKSFL